MKGIGKRSRGVSRANTATTIKQTIEKVLANYVKEHGSLAYRTEYRHEFPHDEWDAGTVVTLHGHSLIHAYARYEGPDGAWEILLSDGNGKCPRNADQRTAKVTHVCGNAWKEK